MAKYKPSYVTVAAPTAPAEYQLGTYTSKYADQLDNALNTVTNWKYNPLEDASYQALAKIYGARGNQAAKNSLADAAALNGGYGTSYAVSAAQQARNQYNQELAALIPDLEANAYNKAQTTLQAYRDADDTDYGRFRDTEGDRQWLYSQNYQKYRDLMSDYQWGTDYNTSLYQSQKKSSGGGGGGHRRSGGGGGGYSSVSGSSGGSNPTAPTTKFREAKGGINNTTSDKKTKKTGYYAGPQK